MSCLIIYIVCLRVSVLMYFCVPISHPLVSWCLFVCPVMYQCPSVCTLTFCVLLRAYFLVLVCPLFSLCLSVCLCPFVCFLVCVSVGYPLVFVFARVCMFSYVFVCKCLYVLLCARVS